MGADQRRQEIQILPFLSFFVKASEKQDGSYGDIGSNSLPKGELVLEGKLMWVPFCLTCSTLLVKGYDHLGSQDFNPSKRRC